MPGELPSVAAMLGLLVAVGIGNLATAAGADVYGWRIQYAGNPHVLDVSFNGVAATVPTTDNENYPATLDGLWTIVEPDVSNACNYGWIAAMWDGNSATNSGCSGWGDYQGILSAAPVAPAGDHEVAVKFFNTDATKMFTFDVYVVDANGDNLAQCAETSVQTVVDVITFSLTGCDYNPGPSSYDYSSCATGSHSPDSSCTCTADADYADTAFVTTLTMDHTTSALVATISGGLEHSSRTVTSLALGNSVGDTCYFVPQSAWTCAGADCSCTANVPIATFITECSPTEVNLDGTKKGFNVYTTAVGDDVRTTDTFGEPLASPVTTPLSATASTSVTTSQTFVEAAGVSQELTTLTVDSRVLTPRSPNSNDNDAELEVTLTMVTPNDYDVFDAVAISHAGVTADTEVDGDVAVPSWTTTCGDTCEHTISFILSTGDLTADPPAACDFSGTTTLTTSMGATAACLTDASPCAASIDVEVDLVEVHAQEVCNPSDDTEDVTAPVEPPSGVTNPESIVTTPGSVFTATWDSIVNQGGVDQDSTLESIQAAVLPAGSPCTTDLTGSAEVHDTTHGDYVDISSIFDVEVDGLGHRITLTLDSSDSTVLTLYSIATDPTDFRSSFAGVFCFVVTRKLTLVDLSRRLALRRVLPAASTSDTSARSAVGMSLTLTGVDASALDDNDAGNDAQQTDDGPMGDSTTTQGTIALTAIVAAAVVAVVAIVALAIVKANRTSGAAATTVTKVLSTATAPTVETVVVRTCDGSVRQAWAE